MRVQVCYEGDHVGRPYTYAYRGQDLTAGDRVLVPATWVSERLYEHDGPQVAVVVALTSDYEGELTRIIRRLC